MLKKMHLRELNIVLFVIGFLAQNGQTVRVCLMPFMSMFFNMNMMTCLPSLTFFGRTVVLLGFCFSCFKNIAFSDVQVKSPLLQCFIQYR